MLILPTSRLRIFLLLRRLSRPVRLVILFLQFLLRSLEASQSMKIRAVLSGDVGVVARIKLPNGASFGKQVNQAIYLLNTIAIGPSLNSSSGDRLHSSIK